jgi:hypothetical protein
MKSRKFYTFPLLYLFAAIALANPDSVYAARVINGALGIWLQEEASPRLSDLLTNHPRFKGERIKIMGMDDGHPMAANNQLTDQIKEQLTHDLLATANVQIVFDDYNRCMPVPVSTILGIEVTRHNSQEYRVTLAMVDREEGIWLNGTNLSWRGRLTIQQRRDLHATTQSHAKQDVYSSQQTTEIADALFDQLRCQRNIIAPVYFNPTEDGITRRVSRRLRERFSSQSQVTGNKRAAASIVYLKFPETSNSIRELSLELATADDQLSTHRIAEVAVTHIPTVADSPVTESTRTPTISTQDYRQGRYLSALHYQDSRTRKGICKYQKRGCVLVDYDLSRSAYVVMFSTSAGEPLPLGCESPTLRQPGKHQFRLKVPISEIPNRPSVGFYALAFKDRSSARAVHRELIRGSATCSNRPTPVDEWASSFSRILSQYREQTEWRALHLSRDTNGVMTL